MLDRSTLKDALKAKADCLSAEELEKLAANPSAGNPHLAGCARCQTELALLKSFESSEPLPEEGAAVAWIGAHLERKLGEIKHPGHRRSSDHSMTAFSRLTGFLRSGSGRWLVPACALLVVAVATAVLLYRPQEPDLRADAGNGPPVYRSQEVEVIAPLGALAKPPEALQWKPVSGSAEYDVSIMEVDEVALWTAKTHDTILTIPVGTRNKMLPGKPLLWRVTAVDGQGKVLAASQLERFSVQRNP